MQKKIKLATILVTALFLSMTFVSAGDNDRLLEIERLAMDEYVRPGGDLRITVTTDNEGRPAMENLNIKVFIYGTETYWVSREFDLKRWSDETLVLPITISEDAQSGDYWMKIVVSNDYQTRIKHRYFTVI